MAEAGANAGKAKAKTTALIKFRKTPYIKSANDTQTRRDE